MANHSGKELEQGYYYPSQESDVYQRLSKEEEGKVRQLLRTLPISQWQHDLTQNNIPIDEIVIKALFIPVSGTKEKFIPIYILQPPYKDRTLDLNYSTKNGNEVTIVIDAINNTDDSITHGVYRSRTITIKDKGKSVISEVGHRHRLSNVTYFADYFRSYGLGFLGNKQTYLPDEQSSCVLVPIGLNLDSDTKIHPVSIVVRESHTAMPASILELADIHHAQKFSLK